MKTILIDDKLHEKVKEISNKTGIKIKSLVESALEWYIKHIKVEVE